MWNDIVAKAKGQTVNFNAWAGDEKTNAFIQWVGEEVEQALRRQGRPREAEGHRRGGARASSPKRPRAATPAARVDLIWINGPNFLAMKQQTLLFGPFTQALPSYADVDTTNIRSNVVDFTIPVDGMESPWRRAQIVFVYDSKRVRQSADVGAGAARMGEEESRAGSRILPCATSWARRS